MSLKIGLIHGILPDLSECAVDPICPKRGSYVDATRLICEAFKNLNCTFSWYKNVTDYGNVDKNGTATGLLGAIRNGEFDTSAPHITPTFNRYKLIDFSQIYRDLDIIMMTRASHKIVVPEIIDFSIVWSFRAQVWITFIIFFLIVGGIILIIHKLETFFNPNSNSLFQITSSAISDLSASLITGNFERRWFRFDSIRIMIAFWLFALLVLTQAYTGLLFSKKMFIKIQQPFTNFETFIDCLERRECQIVTFSKTLSYMQQLENPVTDLNIRYAAAIKFNPIQIMPMSEIPRAILDEKEKYLVSFGPKNVRTHMINGNRDCQFYLVETGFTEVTAFAFAKNSPHLKILNYAATAMREFGFEQAMSAKYDSRDLCDQRPKNSFEPVQLRAFMSTTFWLYAFGIVAGLIIFSLEIMIACNIGSRSSCCKR